MNARGTTAAVLAASIAILAGCEQHTSTATSPSSSPPPSIPDVVDVVCTPDGTKVSPTRVAARPDGVHVRVRSTNPAPVIYLNHPGGGDPVEAGTNTRVLLMAPGRTELNCSSHVGAKQDPPVALEVVDPTGSWKTGGLKALGCSAPWNSIIDWIYRTARGPTADAAMTALATQISPSLTWKPVQEGYVAAARQAYVIDRDGKRWGTAQVNQDGDTYSAYMGSLCDGVKLTAD
jgi:hypothetical protein